MCTWLVPRSLSLERQPLRSAALQKELYASNRNALLAHLRDVRAISQAAGRLSPGDLYRVVLSPRARSYFGPGPGGLYEGVVRAPDGRIVEHVRLHKVGAGLLNAAEVCSVQALLVAIAAHLSEIQENIEQIRRDLHEDRIAEIIAGVNQFEQALLVRNRDNQRALFIETISGLNSGIVRTIRSFRTQLSEAPDPKEILKDWKIDVLRDWHRESSVKKAERQMALAAESMLAALMGIQTLSECYAMLGEPPAAREAMIRLLDQLTIADIEEAYRKARVAPYKPGGEPEALWRRLGADLPLIQAEAATLALREDELPVYDIELGSEAMTSG